jgi:quinol monooxygenase YgiN
MGGAVVILSYRSHPDHAATARREIASLIATVQDIEPDCGGITMLQDASDPTRFTLIEHWPSQEVFLGPHMQQAHIQAFIQSAGAFLAGPPDISFWNPVSGA